MQGPSSAQWMPLALPADGETPWTGQPQVPVIQREGERSSPESPRSPLQRAQLCLFLAEEEEARERQLLRALDMESQRLRAQLREAGGPLVAGKDPGGLSRKREELAERRGPQETELAQARESLLAARRAYEQVHRRALDLAQTIRREERTAAQWQHEIQVAEQHLTRLERLLVEAQARADQARREYAQLTGSWEITPGLAASGRLDTDR